MVMAGFAEMPMRGLAVWLLVMVAGVSAPAAAADDPATCATARGNGAIDACTRLINSGKDKGQKLAVLYRHRCVAWNSNRDGDRGLADCSEAIRLDPNYSSAYSGRCWAFNLKNDPDRAIADCNEAIRLDAKASGAFNNRGVAYVTKRDYTRAIADYDEALKLNPKNAVAFANRGILWGNRRDYDRAIADFDQAISIDPKNAAAYHGRGHVLRVKGEHDRALADFDQSIRLDPKYAFAYNNRGTAWMDKRDYERALADFNEAIRIDSGFTAAYTNRALAYERKGDRARAKTEFDVALTVPQKYASGKWAHDTARERLAALNPTAPGSSQSAADSPAQPSSVQQSAQLTRQAISSQPSSGRGQRVALVIGNAEYPEADPPLTQARNDARLLAEELRSSGFEVELAENLTKQRLQETTDKFKKNARPGSAVLLYYSGYAIQSGRQNYMIPVNAQIWSERDVARDGVSVESVLTDMADHGAAVKLVIVDGSRRNPFERRFRSAAAGLAPIVAPTNTLVISAAGLGQVVNEGGGKNSLFMTELLKEFRAAVVTLDEVFSRARIGVSRATDSEQVPWVSSTLMQAISFQPAEERRRAR
jgi:tetratricopeptide (TPR) repeat protein